ncbi:hypothetical protein D3C80_1159290 [compost metagenome]
MFGTTRISSCMLDSASASGWVDTTTRSHREMPRLTSSRMFCGMLRLCAFFFGTSIM